MKSVLLDVINNTIAEVDASTLDDYYRLLGCTTVDIVGRKIGGKWYDIICDDEGTFVENPKISAINEDGEPMLVGSLLITGPVDYRHGVSKDLKDDDIKNIFKSVTLVNTRKHPMPYKVLVMSY